MFKNKKIRLLENKIESLYKKVSELEENVQVLKDLDINSNDASRIKHLLERCR